MIEGTKIKGERTIPSKSIQLVKDFFGVPHLKEIVFRQVKVSAKIIILKGELKNAIRIILASSNYFVSTEACWSKEKSRM
jgi:hypothetical protein